MRIKDTDKINNRIIEMWEERNFQGRIDAALFQSISLNDVVLENIEPVKAAANDFRKSLKDKRGREISDDQAVMAIMLRSFVDHICPGKFRNPYEENVTISSVIEHSRMFDAKDFYCNSYLKNIKMGDISSGRFSLTTHSYEPYELMFYDAPYKLRDSCIQLPSVGCFRDKFIYPCLLDGNREWMSLTPYEIFTMQEHIDKAKGDILVLGSGLGYYTYMASLKDEVNSVTVIERGKDVAELFRSSILPQFETKDKVKFIEADAFSYLDELPDGKFDMCFADIYDGMGNFDFYYRLKNACRRFRKMKVSCLHEENFLSYASSFVVLEIMETFARERKSKQTTFSNIPERDMRLKTYVANLLKDVEIGKASDVSYYLNTKNILRIMNKSKIEY